MYYGMVGTAVLLFSLQFYCNQIYEKKNGCTVASAMVFSVYSNLAGLLFLFALNRFQPECTLFTLVMAIITAGNGLLFTFCSMRALNKINLSLYSVFSMLGGMTLPFLTGILFYGEALTAGKLLCFILVAVSLLFTLRPGKSKGGGLYYAGIFILNGLSGVLSKIFNDAPFAKTSAAGYSVLTALSCLLLSLLMLPFLKEKPKRLSPLSLLAAAAHGGFNRLANLLLLIALIHLPASAQYPMITGGVMVCSSLLCLFTPDKPKKNEWAAVALSFAGILALIFLP